MVASTIIMLIMPLPIGGIDIGSLESHDASSNQPPKCIGHGKNFLHGESGLAEERTGLDECSWTALFDGTDRHAHEKSDKGNAEGVVEQRRVEGGSKEEGYLVLGLVLPVLVLVAVVFQVAPSFAVESSERGFGDGVGADANEKNTGALNENELLADVIRWSGWLLRLLLLLLRWSGGGSGLHFNVGII